MSEDDEEADLLKTGLKIAPCRRIMAKLPKCKPKLKHFMVLTFIVIIVIYFYLYRTQSDDLIDVKIKPKQKSLKSPEFCSAETLVSRKKVAEDDLKQSSKTRTPSKVLLVPKTSFSKC